MVEARPFIIYTDHKPLTFAFTTARDKCSPRQFRYLDFISQFSTDIRGDLRASLHPGWVARFGCPVKITTDRGRQFESELFHTLSSILGAEHRPTTSYHPACNGIIERLHRQLKSSIMCHSNTHWAEALPLVLLGIRSAWKDDLQASAAELVYGEPLRLPGEFFTPTKGTTVDYTDFAARLRDHIGKLNPVPASHHSKKPFYIPKELSTAEYVFSSSRAREEIARVPLLRPVQGLERRDKTFRIILNGKRTP
ncbi:uncharacterized protein [Choristoneura fumiferana]|uniref:uncharacterized protein n=1 Tax=Choristoneura fumiferana TaxID=7141 RepID=UPI003D15E640